MDNLTADTFETSLESSEIPVLVDLPTRKGLKLK